jgi:hypothetical protein
MKLPPIASIEKHLHMNRKFQMRDIFLLLALVVLTAAAWTGNARTVASQIGVWKKHDLELSQILGREPRFHKPTLSGFMSGSYQEDLEESLRDSFPFLKGIFQGSSDRKRVSGGFWLKLFPVQWRPLKPAGLDAVMITRDHQRLIRRPLIFSDRTESMGEKAGYFKQLAERHPDLRISVFAVQWPDQTFASCELLPEETRRIFAGERYMEQFGKMLEGNVPFSWAGRGNAPEETLSNHYRSDHHLTIEGTYDVYKQLYSLMESGGAKLGAPVRLNQLQRVGSFLFHGSYAQWAGGSTVIGDPIYDADFTLPEFQVTAYHGGGLRMPRNKKNEYRSGTITKGRFASHYNDYFGGNIGQVEYRFAERPNSGTLLVLSDSLDNSMEPLLASHFRQTLFIDERNYEKAMGRPFDIDEIISENGVTDVLFIGTARVMCGVTETYH